MSVDTGVPALDKLCECGHMRRDHADGYSLCDDCPCAKYVGEIQYVAPAAYQMLYGAYGFVGAYIEDDSQTG